jgi:hypothetical protein
MTKEKEMEKQEVERELSLLLSRTIALEDELNALCVDSN